MEPSIFKRTGYSSTLKSTAAFLVFLGALPLNAVTMLILTALLTLPLRFSVAASGLLLFLAVVPTIENGGKCGSLFSRFMCKYICGYFPMTIHVEDIDAFHPDQAYVFGCEPHSIIPIGFCALLHQAGFMPLTKVKYLSSSAVLRVPVLRQIWTWMGFVPVTRENFTSYLNAGYSCIVVPGGLREMLYMEKGNEVALLKSRKGFVRIAMEAGRPLVPVFCFGQTDALSWWNPCGKLPIKYARVISKVIIFWGRFGLPIPYKVPMHIVVGRPIFLKKVCNPPEHEVNEVHARFITDLFELFDRYKNRVGHPDLQLKVI